MHSNEGADRLRKQARDVQLPAFAFVLLPLVLEFIEPSVLKYSFSIASKIALFAMWVYWSYIVWTNTCRSDTLMGHLASVTERWRIELCLMGIVAANIGITILVLLTTDLARPFVGYPSKFFLWMIFAMLFPLGVGLPSSLFLSLQLTDKMSEGNVVRFLEVCLIPIGLLLPWLIIRGLGLFAYDVVVDSAAQRILFSALQACGLLIAVWSVERITRINQRAVGKTVEQSIGMHTKE